jgi:hypothetical protein
LIQILKAFDFALDFALALSFSFSLELVGLGATHNS